MFRDTQFPHSCVGMGFWFAFEAKFGLSSMNYIHYAPYIPHMRVANLFPSVSYVEGEKMKTQKANKELSTYRSSSPLALDMKQMLNGLTVMLME